MKVVDVTGFSFTGKSAVHDLLSEVDQVALFDKEFEFDLIRAPGGLLDLKRALIDDWSLIRSCEAIRDFQRLTVTLSGDRSLLSRLATAGFAYDYYFPGYTSLSELYIESMISSSYKSYWPFSLPRMPRYQQVAKKFMGRLNSNYLKSDVYLAKPSEAVFLSRTREYLVSLFSIATESADTLVLSNAFDLGKDNFIFECLPNARQIIVDRDPRDVYLSARNAGVVNGVNVGAAVIGNSVDDFIQRYRMVRTESLGRQNSLMVRFEELVLNYDHTIEAIFDYLEIQKKRHVMPRRSFNPSNSARGIGLWKTDKCIEIEKITAELADYIEE